jgi:tetratricopeptide (TPR) repeat protein
VRTEARGVRTEALRLSRLAQARNSEADALHRLGMVLHGQGNAAGAVELLQDAVALTSDHRITAVAQLLGLLASVHDDLGNADEARACRLRALDICSRSQTSATREPGEALRRALRV